MITAKFLNLIEVSEMLRSDAATDWDRIVIQSAEWIDPDAMEHLNWPKTLCDLSVLLPGHIRKRLDLGPSLSNPGFGLFVAVTVALAERAAGKPLDALRTPAEIKTALDALPGSYAPHLLISLWRKRRLKQEHLRATLLDVWRNLDHAAVWPMKTWRAMFRCVGFLSDREPRPTRPLTVYRGCTPSGRRGMSWTNRREVAEKFANFWVDQGYATVRGNVYKARVKPRDVLAMIEGQKKMMPKLKFVDERVVRHPDVLEEVLVKPEFEVIIDARALQITLIETWQAICAREIREGVRGNDMTI